MERFDPASERELLERHTGYRFVLGYEFEESRRVGGLASCAHLAYLLKAIACLLVGYDEPARQLLKRAFDWVTIAIDEDEKPQDYEPEGTEAERYETLAMCNWLLHGIHDGEGLSRSVEHRERFLIASDLGRNRTEVSLTSLGYVDAGAYQIALERLAAARLSAPTALNAIRNEGQMCYVICRHRLGLQYSEREVASTTEKFLKRSVNGWLIDGHYDRAAQWMKVVHWREGTAGLSPKEAVLMCYKYLPDAVNLPKMGL